MLDLAQNLTQNLKSHITGALLAHCCMQLHRKSLLKFFTVGISNRHQEMANPYRSHACITAIVWAHADVSQPVQKVMHAQARVYQHKHKAIFQQGGMPEPVLVAVRSHVVANAKLRTAINPQAASTCR